MFIVNVGIVADRSKAKRKIFDARNSISMNPSKPSYSSKLNGVNASHEVLEVCGSVGHSFGPNGVNASHEVLEVCGSVGHSFGPVSAVIVDTG
ncbi:hypothetical protein JHK85_046374 [Glycine max]|nr:hypothetical protein JHK85_046374 [Glycine max]